MTGQGAAEGGKTEQERFFTVAAVERFSAKDGPGIRTVIFFKGCPLHCAWCHNPEMQSASPEILYYPDRCVGCGACAAVCPAGARKKDGGFLSREACVGCGRCVRACLTGASEIAGRRMSASEILSRAAEDAVFYTGGGGITLSGGEPFAQEGIEEILRGAAARGLSVAAETSGYAPRSVLERAAEYVGLFLWDVKDTIEARHRRYVGGELQTVLENLRAVDALGGKTLLRCPMVRGVNAGADHLRGLAELSLSLKYCAGVQILPCHAGGRSKNRALGREDGAETAWVTTDAETERCRQALRGMGAKVWEEGEFPAAPAKNFP